MDEPFDGVFERQTHDNVLCPMLRQLSWGKFITFPNNDTVFISRFDIYLAFSLGFGGYHYRLLANINVDRVFFWAFMGKLNGPRERLSVSFPK